MIQYGAASSREEGATRQEEHGKQQPGAGGSGPRYFFMAVTGLHTMKEGRGLLICNGR